MTFSTWRVFSSTPMPKPSTPALLPTMVSRRVPDASSAPIRFSGMPHRPKPPAASVMPSNSSPSRAAAALA